jgi:2-keto-4-pentenoate hydratase/2-oxohepta-3-ene-1,7-dioic acid hydratase in catechol pathway
VKTIQRLFGIAAIATIVCGTGSEVAAQSISNTPDTPFKLATYKSHDAERVGLVLGDRIVDVAGANDFLLDEARLSSMAMPGDMRTPIEEYASVKGRLYQVANYFSEKSTDGRDFAYDVGSVSIQAPIKCPWNILVAAANYRAHAAGMADNDEKETGDVVTIELEGVGTLETPIGAYQGNSTS